jgi:UDP-N-acetylglucosamine 4,6-dehydratase
MFDKINSLLITGGSGSLGIKLVQVLLEKNNIEKIVVLSRNEKAQYMLKKRIEEQFGAGALPKVKCILGDIRDAEKVNLIVKDVNFVIHAAALKHIVIGEEQPEEFVKTNVLGTLNVVNSCTYYDKKMLFISTDKACMPTNMYGMSKALAERIVTNAGFICVRYGNVAGSNGSVIPFFLNLIRHGKMLPVTDLNMTRFFLTLGDAVDLIFEAMRVCEPGDILIKKAHSLKIIDLAKYMGKRYGNNDDYPVRIVGLQTFGEKIHEILIAPHEVSRTIDLGSYYKVCSPKVRIENAVLNIPYSSEKIAENSELELENLFNRLGEITF